MLLSLTSRLIEGVAEPATAAGAPGEALTQAATQIPVIARASAAVAMSMPPGPAGSQQSLSRVPSGSQRSSVSRIPVRAPPASDIMPALMADVDDGMPPASQEMFSRAARAARGASSAPPTSSISVNGTSFPHSLYSTFTLSLYPIFTLILEYTSRSHWDCSHWHCTCSLPLPVQGVKDI